eukprot:205037-Amphidinium_carterae.1
MEMQQRSDARVWRKHYCHAAMDEVREGLEYGAAPNVMTPKRTKPISSPLAQPEAESRLEAARENQVQSENALPALRLAVVPKRQTESVDEMINDIDNANSTFLA